MRFLTILVVFATLIELRAQPIDPSKETVKWISGSFYDNQFRSNTQLDCHFVTYGKQRIQWIQRNGALVYNLEVQHTKGNWTDIAKDGQLEYAVRSEGLEGTLTFRRESGMLSLVLKFPAEPTGPIDLVYSIVRIEKL